MLQRRIRVLVVDDSTVIRRLLSDILTEDQEIEVAGTAANGRIAIAKIPQVNPDVVTLDMEMPEMDGLTTLVEIRKVYPKLPIIMFSTLTSRGATATLDALSLGANDYVAKPANVGSVMTAMQAVRQELVPKVKGLCDWYNKRIDAATATTPARNGTAPRSINRIGGLLRQRGNAVVDIVAIGVSTGGPNALATVLPKLTPELPVPVVIVQHMPPVFTKHLADRLNSYCSIEVVEAKNGDVLSPGKAWIAPGNFHLTVRRKGSEAVLVTNQDPHENSCRPAVDVLFRSIAESYGPNALACVLTGMGQDGKRGCESIHDAGGFIIAQDEATSVVWGMPRAVVHAGLADSIQPLEEVATEIQKQCDRNRDRFRQPKRTTTP